MRKFNFKIPVTIFREGDAFVSYSPALDLSTTASTFEGTKKDSLRQLIFFLKKLKKWVRLKKCWLIWANKRWAWCLWVYSVDLVSIAGFLFLG